MLRYKSCNLLHRSGLSQYFQIGLPNVQCPFNYLSNTTIFSIHLHWKSLTNKGAVASLWPNQGKDNRGRPWHYCECTSLPWWRVSHWPLLKSSSTVHCFVRIWSTLRVQRRRARWPLLLPSNLSKEKIPTDPRLFLPPPFLLFPQTLVTPCPL